MKKTIREMLEKISAFGEYSISEEFMLSEFGKEGFKTLKALGMIRRGSGLGTGIRMTTDHYVREAELISPENRAEFRARIKARTNNSEMLTALPEKAELLPKFGYPPGQSCISGFVLLMNKGNELEQESVYLTTSSPQFDNVLGFRIDEHLIVTRYASFGYYPENNHLVARRFGGRIPTETEFLKIAAKLDQINASLHAIDEDCLPKGYYLVAPDLPPLPVADSSNENCCSAQEFLKAASTLYKVKIPKHCLPYTYKQKQDFLVINIENPDDRKIIKKKEKCAALVVI